MIIDETTSHMMAEATARRHDIPCVVYTSWLLNAQLVGRVFSFRGYELKVADEVRESVRATNASAMLTRPHRMLRMALARAKTRGQSPVAPQAQASYPRTATTRTRATTRRKRKRKTRSYLFNSTICRCRLRMCAL